MFALYAIDSANQVELEVMDNEEDGGHLFVNLLFAPRWPATQTMLKHQDTNQKAGLALVKSCSKYAWNHVPASGAGCRASACLQWKSYRAAVVLLVPSHSPPGFTQTNASSSSRPVLLEGRVPKPVPTRGER